MTRFKKILLGFAFPAVVLLVWGLATGYGNIPRSVLAAPWDVWAVFTDKTSGPRVLHELLISLWRVVQGFLIALALGLVFGTLLAVSKTAKSIFLPTFTAIRQVPVIALIPLIILWAGIGELQKIIVIVIAAFFPVMMNTFGGIIETPVSLLEVARLYKLSKLRTFISVYLPYALPQIFVGLQLGLGVSWMAVVAAELISASKGIGYYLGDARAVMGSDIMIACMLVIGLVGAVMNYGITYLFGAITPWKVKENSSGLAGRLPQKKGEVNVEA